MPKVFISYSHDSSEHAARVLALADHFIQDGLDCILDQYEGNPPEGWPLWMDRQIEQADYVLMICTETYHNRVMGKEQAGVGLAFVKEKQEQAHNPWNDVLTATINLEALAYNQNPPDEMIITWNELNTLTEVERSKVFSDWCTGIQKLVDSHAITLEGIHALLLELTNNKITSKFEEFKKQVKEYGTIRAMLEQEYGGMRDFDEGEIPEIEEGKAERIQRNGYKKNDKLVNG